MNKVFLKIIIITAIILAILLILSGSFYTYWSLASPEKTCTSCHEINNSYQTWLSSAHRNINCTECHGTAISEGFHSMGEKLNMIKIHYQEKNIEEIRLSEKQILKSMESCILCHQSEYADWLSGGHSATYEAIFLNERQNTREKPFADCLRCHGMFYNGTISDLIYPLNNKGPWHLKDPAKSKDPVIPCMACHTMHSSGNVAIRQDYAYPEIMDYNRPAWIPALSFYDRNEKISFHSSLLPKPLINDQGIAIRVSDDPRQKVCTQCHAPDVYHQSGSNDDRTPRGVHEGISCMACHAAHNNDTKSSCKICHPILSNCGLDVEKMNTTFSDSVSQNNIHFVTCFDCHQKKMK
jgi:nitrate/TMAO reductase-like tetraheme cytochrome c subunit